MDIKYSKTSLNYLNNTLESNFIFKFLLKYKIFNLLIYFFLERKYWLKLVHMTYVKLIFFIIIKLIIYLSLIFSFFI